MNCDFLDNLKVFSSNCVIFSQYFGIEKSLLGERVFITEAVRSHYSGNENVLTLGLTQKMEYIYAGGMCCSFLRQWEVITQSIRWHYSGNDKSLHWNWEVITKEVEYVYAGMCCG